ncbi:hypothetical protein [Dendronalium sp. ChiSLP03b]|nr:hypothetical protein [Dendronalium sp. ChiSLP03b]
MRRETRPRGCLPVVATAVKWRETLRDRASGGLPKGLLAHY